MADVPLGKSAYRRSYGQEPEIKMVNRFFEQDPTNQVSGTALLSRAGTTLVQTVGNGPIRGLHTRSGAFNSDLFVVSADSLFRIAPDGTEIAITGTLDGPVKPWMTITTGPGFENLFISDGDSLFVYEGISCSRGTLEADSGGSLVDGDQVRIGDTYYKFTTGDVDAGTPAGTSTDPWLVALGTAKASARLVFLNDGRIDIAGYAVFIGNIPAGTTPGEGGDLRFVYTMSAPDELERNNPRGTGDNPWRLATREGITPRSYLSLLKSAINATGSPGVDYSRELVAPHDMVTADEVAGGVSPTNPRDNYLTVRALTGGADGNDIQVRNVLDRAPIFRWEDEAGNPVLSLTGGSDTASDVPSALTNLSRAIDATGIPGTDYSSDLTAHPDARTEFLEGPVLDIVACDGAASNSIVTTTTSTGLAWGAGTLTGGGEHRLDPVEMPDNLPAGSLNTLGGFVTISVYEDDRFYWIRPGERIIDPLNFATAESAPDKIVESLTLADQLVLFGGSTTEFWSATGNPELPFRPSRGQTLDIGAIPNTPAKTTDGIIFVGSDGAVYATSGGPAQKVSTNGIDERVRLQLASAASDDGMQSFTFDQDGHTFFVLHLDPDLPPEIIGYRWVWGDNDEGELGTGDKASLNSGTVVADGGLVRWKNIVMTYRHSLGIQEDGSLWVWGLNFNGELGLGDRVERLSPTLVPGGDTYLDVAAGIDTTGNAAYSLVIKSDGTLWSTGFNDKGELGLGDTTQRESFTQVGTDTDWAQVKTQYGHVMAVKNDGSLWGWGWNNSGQLGIGNKIDAYDPRSVDPGPITSFEAASARTMLTKDGKYFVAGASSFGQLGDGLGSGDYGGAIVEITTPVPFLNVTGAQYESFGIDADGNLWSTGRNTDGQLGQGDTTQRTTFTKIPFAGTWKKAPEFGPQSRHVLAIASDGLLWGWGDNGTVDNQLGLLSPVGDELSPVRVDSDTDTDWELVLATFQSSQGLKRTSNS